MRKSIKKEKTLWPKSRESRTDWQKGRKKGKKCKQVKRAAKAAEWLRIAEEEAANKAGTGRKRRAGEQSVNQRNSKKNKTTGHEGLQGEILSECVACFGLYEDDVDYDGTVSCDWIQCTNEQCTNEQCSLWMHTNYLDKSDGEYMCAVHWNIFP